MEKVNAETAVEVGVEGLEDGLRVVEKIRKDDEGSFPFDERMGAVERFGDGGSFAGFVVLESSEEVVEMTSRGSRFKEFSDFFVEELEGDAVVLRDNKPAQASGEERGVFQFGEGGFFLKAHGGGAIEEDVALHVGLLLEGLEVVPFGAGKDAPIDEREVIAGDILTILGELDGGPAFLRAMAPGEEAFDEGLDAKLVVAEPPDVLRADEFVSGLCHLALFDEELCNDVVHGNAFARRVVVRNDTVAQNGECDVAHLFF